jgi:hypothetical protein
MLAAHERRKAEVAAFRAALAAALEERDGESRRLISDYEKGKKAGVRRVTEEPDALDDVVRGGGGGGDGERQGRGE